MRRRIDTSGIEFRVASMPLAAYGVASGQDPEGDAGWPSGVGGQADGVRPGRGAAWLDGADLGGDRGS